ncbi:MAG: DUF6904 family protein [Candidatus Weimeria sp.]
MIRIVPTEHMIGVKLQGDYNDLQELYDALGRYLEFYQVSTDYPYDDYEYLLALNYDIRHAYMGTRDVTAVENNYDEYIFAKTSEDSYADLSDEEKALLKQYRKDFTKNNLYFSVDIAVPLILYYIVVFQKVLDGYYSNTWFKKYNDHLCSEGIDLSYDPMTAEQDRAQMHLFIAAVWDYLKSILGEEDSRTLFQYLTYNDEGMIFPYMYIDAVLAYYHENAAKLSQEDLKKFIIYIAYGIMDPVSTRYKNKNLLACHNQYQQVKADLKGKLIKALPSYLTFIGLENKYFGNETDINSEEFDSFIGKYFGNADWDNMEW